MDDVTAEEQTTKALWVGEQTRFWREHARAMMELAGVPDINIRSAALKCAQGFTELAGILLTKAEKEGCAPVSVPTGKLPRKLHSDAMRKLTDEFPAVTPEALTEAGRLIHRFQDRHSLILVLAVLIGRGLL